MIGVFGGTFDPPHLGHSILADLGCDQLGLEKVLWAPAGDPPHKPDDGVSSIEDRVAMVEAAIEADGRFELSRVDLDRQGPHFAADCMEALRVGMPGAEFAYLMGADSLRDLPSWHDPVRFIRGCDLIAVLRRPGAALDLDVISARLPGLVDRVRVLDSPLIEISGSDIRARVRGGRSYRYFVLRQVNDHIRKAGLYQ